jgi:prevent-host-death family protein
MHEEIGSYDAMTKLPEILRRVEVGESFTITNRGKPIAEIVPSRATSRLKCKAAISNIKKAKKHGVSDADLKAMM